MRQVRGRRHPVDLMVHGSARFRSLLVQRLHAGDRLADASNLAPGSAWPIPASSCGAPAILASIVGVAGGRRLTIARAPTGFEYRIVPIVAGRRRHGQPSPCRRGATSMMGSAQAGHATHSYWMSALSTLLLGHTALARTVVVAGALPLGIWGAFRVARALDGCGAARGRCRRPRTRRTRLGAPRSAAATSGRSCRFALAPFIVLAVVRAGSAAAGPLWPGDEPRPTASRPGARRYARSSWSACSLRLVAGAVWPPAILFPALVADVFAISVLFMMGDRRILRGAALAASWARSRAWCAPLSPWSWSPHRGRRRDARAAVPAPVPCRGARRFDSVGPAPRSGWITLGLDRGGRGAVGDRERSAALVGDACVAARACVVRAASGSLARTLGDTAPFPAPEGVLVPGRARTGGGGRARRQRVARRDMRRSRFGWRQVSAIAVKRSALALPLLALGADAGSGRCAAAEQRLAHRGVVDEE